MKSSLNSIAITVVLCLFASNRLVRFTRFYDDLPITVSPSSYSSDPQVKPRSIFRIALVDKTCLITHRYAAGDLVLFISPVQPDQILIQRIIAQEGTYMYETKFRDFRRIPKGHCWVQATHPLQMGTIIPDSNVFGPISIGLIQGRIKAIVWPLKDFRWIKSPSSSIDA